MFKKVSLSVAFGLIVVHAIAQAPVPDVPQTQPYGKINQADLELKTCDFEKEANAMVLFNKAELYYDQQLDIIIENHKRIKIFNANGEKETKIRIEYNGGNNSEYISGLQAETINAGADGKPEITRLDKKQIFTEHVDRIENAMVFTFPNVKPGSVIEYKYTETIKSATRIPAWYFQEDVPVRYSELVTNIPEFLEFNTKTSNFQQYSKRKSDVKNGSIGSGQNLFPFNVNQETRAMSNLHSVPVESYMSSINDNLQSIHFALSAIRPVGVMQQTFADTWAKIGKALADDEDFGMQLKKKLSNEEVIVTKAKALKSDDEKIAYVFGEVKNAMKWNGADLWYTNDGIKAAWEKKSGNSTEINIVLCHLLMQAGVKAYPMIVSTREHGRVNPSYAFIYQFNRSVVYVPVDSARHYVLDASSKYNCYNETPANLLNSYGLYINKAAEAYDLVFLQRQAPVMQSVYIQAEISDKGKMNGTAEISSNSYNRLNCIQAYKTDGEKKYMDNLRDGNNALSVTGLKMENMDVDTLPLKQEINFKSELTGSDDSYIYFNPNLFTSLNTNPFLKDTRYTDIDFGYKKMYAISGAFKLPGNFKVDALPKNVNLTMPDNSITFRRLLAVEEGTLIVRYIITYNNAIYFKEDYQTIHEFHKKMQEMLNEQIVLKKG